MDASYTNESGEIGSKIGVRFYRYRAILRRYWWIVATCIALGLLFEGWKLFNKTQRFVSIGKLSVRETSTDENNRSVVNDPSWFGTVVATIESPAVRERANKRVLTMKPESERLIDSVEIKAENEVNTYIFRITGSGTDPAFTQYYVDAVVEAFRELRREEAKDGLGARISRLTQTVEKERAELKQAQDEITKFQDENSVHFIEQERERITTELADTKKEREDLLQRINTAKTINENNLLKNSGGKKNTADSDLNSNNLWLEAKSVLAQRQARLAERGTVWKPAHPRYKALEQEIRDLEIRINQMRAQAAEDRTALVASLEAELATKDKALVELEQKARDFAKTMGRYDTLKDELDRRDAQYKSTRAMLDREMLSGGSLEILGVSQRASEAVPENRGTLKHLLTGLFGGLILGLGILFLIDRADDRVASSSEMIERFNEPILAQIPDVSESRTSDGLPLLQEDDERYMYAEALRSLRSSLIFMPNQSELKTLIITSAIPNEGKSTIASNLSITMANAGAKTLLVDADLRRGDIAQLFELDGRQGLSNILRAETEWRNCVKKLRDDKLHIIPRGPVTNQSSELLLKPTLPKLLEEWKASYDLVIFNTAPILATDDTPTLAPNFDGTLMVVRASFTSARLTRNALNALYQRQVNILGLVLNGVDTEIPDYYYYRYPKYYAA